MIDRFGDQVRVGFAPHEILWIKAALTLVYHERPAAYRDIAAMSGRSLPVIRRKANEIEGAMIIAAAHKRWEESHVGPAP